MTSEVGREPSLRLRGRPRVVYTPDPGPATSDEEKQKCVQKSQLAPIDIRKKRRVKCQLPMKLCVRNGHRAAGQKRRPSGEETDGDGEATDQFDHASHPYLRSESRWRLRQDAKDLLHAVKAEEQTGSDAQDRV